MPPPVMSTMGVGRGIISPNDSVWRYQPPAIKEMIELWSGNSGLSVPPPMMRTGVYGMQADGSVWEYAPTAAGGLTKLFSGQYIPSITGISPSSGSGGTSVSITGTGFTGATAVKFGSTNATSFTVNSDTSITAISPLTNGVSPITITTPAGTSIAGAQSQWTAISTFTYWNPNDTTPIGNLAFSNGNLTVTSTAGAGGGVRALNNFLPANKYYFEVTWVTIPGFPNSAVGFAVLSANFGNGLPINAQTAGTVRNGSIYIASVMQGASGSLGAWSNGDVIGLAMDLPANLLWIRRSPSGNWNASGTANPTTGAGGYNLAPLTSQGVLYPFALSSGAGDVFTANFGGSTFSGAVPSGFMSGLQTG